MTQEMRERVYHVVDLLAPKNKSKLYLLIKDYMETDKQPAVKSLDEMFENEKPALRIHKNLEECESCSS